MTKEQKQKTCYTLTVEGIAPVVMKVQTWAFDEEEALKQLNNLQLCTPVKMPRVDLPQIKKHKVTVMETYTSLVKLTKNY
jgi:hypothetical protein